MWEGHRAVPTTHYHDIPVETRGAGKALAIDWTGFDRRFGRYLDGSAFSDGVPVNFFSLPVNLHAGWPGRLATEPAKVDAETLTAAARLIGRHWDEKGWRLDDAFVYVADEPGPERFASVRKACQAIRLGDPRIRTSVAFYTEFGRDARGLVEAFTGLVTSGTSRATTWTCPPCAGGRQRVIASASTRAASPSRGARRSTTTGWRSRPGRGSPGATAWITSSSTT